MEASWFALNSIYIYSSVLWNIEKYVLTHFWTSSSPNRVRVFQSEIPDFGQSSSVFLDAIASIRLHMCVGLSEMIYSIIIIVIGTIEFEIKTKGIWEKLQFWTFIMYNFGLFSWVLKVSSIIT